MGCFAVTSVVAHDCWQLQSNSWCMQPLFNYDDIQNTIKIVGHGHMIEEVVQFDALLV